MKEGVIMVSFGHSFVSNNFLNFDSLMRFNNYTENNLDSNKNYSNDIYTIRYINKQKTIDKYAHMVNDLESKMLSYDLTNDTSLSNFRKSFEDETDVVTDSSIDELLTTGLFKTNKYKQMEIFQKLMSTEDLALLIELITIFKIKHRVKDFIYFNDYISLNVRSFHNIQDLMVETSYILYGSNYNNLELYDEKSVVLEVIIYYIRNFILGESTTLDYGIEMSVCHTEVSEKGEIIYLNNPKLFIKNTKAGKCFTVTQMT